jgi:ribosomal 30S subunit maturation factor RimM
MKILDELKAEVILKDTNILSQVQKLKGLLVYETDGVTHDFEKYFHVLNSEIKAIERIELLTSVPPGGAQSYLVELSMALQMVTDKIEMAQTRAIYFQGKLKSALHVKDNLLATFSAWYLIAIAEKLKEAELKIPASTQKALAESEFSRLLEDMDINIEGLLSAVEVMVTHLKDMRKIAQEKYKLGTDQANASLTNLPFNGHKDGGESLNAFPLLKQRWNVTEEKPKVDPTEFDDLGEETPDLPEIASLREEFEEPAYIQRRQTTDIDVPQGIHKIISGGVEEAVLEEEVSAEDLTASITKFRNSLVQEVPPELPQSEAEEEYFKPSAKIEDFRGHTREFTHVDEVAHFEDEDETVNVEPPSVVGTDVGFDPGTTATVVVKDGVFEDSFAGTVLVKEGKATLVPLSKKPQKKIDFDEDDDTEIVVKPTKKTDYDDEDETIEPAKEPETKKKKKVISFDEDDAF